MLFSSRLQSLVYFACVCYLAAFALHTVAAVLEDQNENCSFWASIGECSKNPNYMLTSCSLSCSKIKQQQGDDLPASFYNIVETDLYGNSVDFSAFRDRVVYLMNVASHCGYTEQNYAQLRSLQKYEGDGLIIVLAPCNSFGFQEPGDALAISTFAGKQGFQANGNTRFILAKGDVNGDGARSSFRYLKYHANKPDITWNFDGKFLVGRDGQVHNVGGPDVGNTNVLESHIRKLLDQPVPNTAHTSSVKSAHGVESNINANTMDSIRAAMNGEEGDL